MSAEVLDRSRMIFELPSDVQMAIRLRAVKEGVTTGDIVCQAITTAYKHDLDEAKTVLAQTRSAPKTSAKRQRA